ncbi:MAG: hypothetical protein IJ007_08625 [Oscillospiraceae bacterium]|nr:hypothetical protein [Oscillospiraceae bacterium]
MTDLYLYHYYEKDTQPFLNISDLNSDEAEKVMNSIRINRPDSQCAGRHRDYVTDRLFYENIMREEFLKKGGNLQRNVPHYMTLGRSPWLSTWFEKPAFIKIPLDEFDKSTLSFTYGDSHPTFSPRITDGKEYRKKLYLYDEIFDVIARYGFPQDWNDDGKFGPERYIEVQVWSNETVDKYRMNILKEV